MTIDYAAARENMVEQQVRPWDVLDLRVLEVISRLPREAFVPEIHRALAYADIELPLGNGQHMMKPVLEGRTLQAANVQADEDVLEIGTGSGYLSACLGAMGRSVVSLEIDPALADAARTRLEATGLGTNVRVETADALSYSTEQRFDVICITGAVTEVPAQLLSLLRPGGRLFVVRGHSPAMEGVLVRNNVNGLHTESLFETDLPYLVGAAPAPQFAL